MPFDDNTPLSAYGSFFIARPEALVKITSAGYRHEDFPDESDYGDGALTHVVERLVSYAVLSTGHHCREVMNAELAATNYLYLEYRAIAVGAKLPGVPAGPGAAHRQAQENPEEGDPGRYRQRRRLARRPAPEIARRPGSPTTSPVAA